jgi:hypothetical protein
MLVSNKIVREEDTKRHIFPRVTGAIAKASESCTRAISKKERAIANIETRVFILLALAQVTKKILFQRYNEPEFVLMDCWIFAPTVKVNMGVDRESKLSMQKMGKIESCLELAPKTRQN